MEYDMHHRDLSVPLQFTLGHCHESFSQAFPFNEVGIMMYMHGKEELAGVFSSMDEASL